jgi:Activator of Hsp90 ATPase homolog 1-like protein
MTENLADQLVQKVITVRCPVEHAFRTFTEGIGTWWPLATHSRGEARAESVVIEGREGGRLYEVWDDGSEHSWGTVIAWEPPTRLAVSWKVNPEALAATEWEVRFVADGGGETRVELEHRGWEALGAGADRSYASYDAGWDAVLGAFVRMVAPS